MLTEINTKNKQQPCNTSKPKQRFERNCVLRKHYLSVAVYYILRDLHILSPSYIHYLSTVLKNNTFVRPQLELLHRKHQKPYLQHKYKIYVEKVGLLAWPLKKQQY